MLELDDHNEEEKQKWRIIPARREDFEALSVLFAALHHYNASLDEKFTLAPEWKNHLYKHFLCTCTSPDALWLLAWFETEPVGLLILENHIDSPLFQERTWVELVALYVAPACRKTGLAYHLMNEAYRWVAERGRDRMQLYVTASNEGARVFYRNAGWHLVQEVWRKV